MHRSLIAVASVLFTLTLPAFSQSPDTANPYARRPREMAISGEVGANSLASLIGPVYSYYVKPQFALDLGVGVSTTGLRPGLRARYNFSMAKLTPFVSGAFKYGMGTTGSKISLGSGSSKEEFQVKAKPSPFLDLGFGLDYLANNGFLFLGSLGYSALLGGKNYEVLEGFVPSQKSKDELDLLFGSGIMLSVALGKAF